eukprot:241463-Amphidinium_carterae.1
MGLPAASVEPDAAASAEWVPPDSAGAGNRLPGFAATVGRLPDLTSLAKRKGRGCAARTGSFSVSEEP